jgi:hypothetical protein
MATLPETTPTTNAGDGDQGTNPPTRDFEKTQSTSDYNTGFEGYVRQEPRFALGATSAEDEQTRLALAAAAARRSGNSSEAVAPTSTGVGATDDSVGVDNTGVDAAYGGASQEEFDAITKAQQGTVTGALNSNSLRPIVPRSNILDRFASYTYRASVYLMSPDEYTQLARSNKKNINSYSLLFQSGGAPSNKGGFTGALNANANDATGGANTINFNSADAGRNPAFPLDFYIDSITLYNLLQGGGTGAASSSATLKFTVIEPLGITLIDRLYQAVQDHAPDNYGTGKINYSSAQYLMVLRWYGYDIDGNLIKGGPTLTDPNAVVEKFIPFSINTINWSVGSKLVSYEFDCTPIGQIIAGGTRRGTVPYDLQLSNSTVAGILGGTVSTQPTTAAAPGASTTSSTPDQSAVETRRLQAANAAAAPPNANAAGNPNKVIKTGLMGALNEFNQVLTQGQRPKYRYADQYEIVFVGEAKRLIGDATIVLPGEKKQADLTPMGGVVTRDAQAANQATDQKNTTQSTSSIVAGQPIVQVIEKVIRNSSYITSQQITQINPLDNDQKSNSNARNKSVNWFRINYEAIPLKLDNLRNDYSYKIRYLISVYKLDKYDSKYFPVGNFRGVHKSYPWWFTGKNTAIIDYNETLNSAYTMLVSGSNPEDSQAEIERRKIASTMREMMVYTYGPTSSESMQGSQGKGNEAAANLADSLYASADLAMTKLRIIGDPAWIQQGSISGGVTADDLDSGSFLPDGTINFDAEQILFEVTWNRPEDYDITTGLSTPNGKKPPISRVYLATGVTSEFRQGKFEQTINGNLHNFPKPDGSNKALTAPLPVKQVDRGDTKSDEQTRLALAADAARRSGNSSNSPALAPQLNVNPSNNTPQTLNIAPPGPNDTVAPALPPQPATSGSGENLDVGDPFVPPGTLSGRITADGLANSPAAPQDIVRDY